MPVLQYDAYSVTYKQSPRRLPLNWPSGFTNNCRRCPSLPSIPLLLVRASLSDLPVRRDKHLRQRAMWPIPSPIRTIPSAPDCTAGIEGFHDEARTAFYAAEPDRALRLAGSIKQSVATCGDYCLLTLLPPVGNWPEPVPASPCPEGHLYLRHRCRQVQAKAYLYLLQL
jgi:hypothetical protein